jgi:AcrR family transcriptional regulator
VPEDAATEEEGTPNRRQALVAAAFKRIAESGFEGLRTRDVAADAGVNVATLHYYFPTKEALIRGVVGHAMLRFSRSMPSQGSAAEQLRWHLAFLHRLVSEDTELFAVMAELILRAPRDPVIGAILRDTDEPWHRKVSDLLRRGVDEGCLSPDLDPDEAAAFAIATIKGVSLPSDSPLRQQRIDQTFDQLERWLGLEVPELGH